LVLVTGDFNICGREINPVMTKRLMRENPEFISILKDLYLEYRIMTELLSSGGAHSVIDLVKRDHNERMEDICTFGDYYVNEIGEQVPLEKVLTVKVE
jgi:hypothetical protein